MKIVTADTNHQARYDAERARLVGALGMTTAGGVIEAIQHVGSTSVQGLSGSDFIDIALAVWPCPLEAGPEAALALLGYGAQPTVEGASERRYGHAAARTQLLVYEAGSQAWGNAVLLRDYLGHVGEAREAFNRARAGGGTRADWFEVQLSLATEWWIGHHGFGPVEAVAAELEGFGGLWLVAGGWSLDLHVGEVGRVHHDVDVVVDRADQLALQAHLLARGWDLLTPLDGKLEPWPPHMALDLPRHQAHAHRGEAFIDFLLTDLSGGVWRFRRAPVVVRSLEQARLRTAAGIPYLAPELGLLFKSKNTQKPPTPRPQDEADFERVCGRLNEEQKAWLRWALTATTPAHAWRGRLV